MCKKALLLTIATTACAGQKELIKEKLIRFPEFRDPFSWLAPQASEPTVAKTKQLIAQKEILTQRPKTEVVQQEVVQPIEPEPVAQQQYARAENPPAWNVVGVAHSGARPLALLAHNEHGTKLARLNDDLGHGWHIAKITAHGIVCKHANGAAQELLV